MSSLILALSLGLGCTRQADETTTAVPAADPPPSQPASPTEAPAGDEPLPSEPPITVLNDAAPSEPPPTLPSDSSTSLPVVPPTEPPGILPAALPVETPLEPPAESPEAATHPTRPAADAAVLPGVGATAVIGASAIVQRGSAVPQEEHEPLFVGWPRPLATLFITGRQHGYIEPCGCTGLDNQLGGLSRRHAALEALRRRGWSVAPIDMGNQVRRFGRQAEIKFQMTVDEALKPIGYQAIAFGPDDLRLSATELLASVAPVGNETSRFVSANVSLFGLNVRAKVINAGGKKIGVTAVLGVEYSQGVNNDEIEIIDPVKALGAVVPKLMEHKCDVYVLLSHGTTGEAQRLARQFPQFDVIVTTGGGGEPTNLPVPVAGSKVMLVQTGIKGMYVGVIGLFNDPQQPLRYQRISLSSRFPDSPQMLELLSSYQGQLEQLGLDGLGVRPVAHPSGRTFVGSEACADCHDEAYAIWEKTTHATALKALTDPPERKGVPRHHDPECISCHVVGWDPQGYTPYKTGYWSLDDAETLGNVGCETCHGPGSAHVAAELGDEDVSDAEMERRQHEMRSSMEKIGDELLSPAHKRCLQCHDLDNSPDFQPEGAFEEYWEKVAH